MLGFGDKKLRVPFPGFFPEKLRSMSFISDDEESQPLAHSSSTDALINESKLKIYSTVPSSLSLFRLYAIVLHFTVVVLASLLFHEVITNADVMPLKGRSWCTSSIPVKTCPGLRSYDIKYIH